MTLTTEDKLPMMKVAIWENGEIYITRTSLGKGEFEYHFPQSNISADAVAIALHHAAIKVEVNSDDFFSPERRNNITTAKGIKSDRSSFNPPPGTDFGIFTSPTMAVRAMMRHHPEKSKDEIAYLEFMQSLKA